MNGWEAESDVAALLNGLGVDTATSHTLMSDKVPSNLKVKVPLAKAPSAPGHTLAWRAYKPPWLDAIVLVEEFLPILWEHNNSCIHDRYFLYKVCTMIMDIDSRQVYSSMPNYDFLVWAQVSCLPDEGSQQKERRKDQGVAGVHSKILCKCFEVKAGYFKKESFGKDWADISPSSRKYPYIDFRPNREIGNEVLAAENLSKTIDGEKTFDNISLYSTERTRWHL